MFYPLLKKSVALGGDSGSLLLPPLLPPPCIPAVVRISLIDPPLRAGSKRGWKVANNHGRRPALARVGRTSPDRSCHRTTSVGQDSLTTPPATTFHQGIYRGKQRTTSGVTPLVGRDPLTTPVVSENFPVAITFWRGGWGGSRQCRV